MTYRLETIIHARTITKTVNHNIDLSQCSYVCTCVFLLVTVPLSPDGVSCGELTNRSVEVWIHPPNMLLSSFVIAHYELTYTSIIANFNETQTRDVVNTSNSVAEAVLLSATAGVTYSVTVMSRSGHLSSRPVLTTCTAGQF